jgi:hypothetical protein
MAVVQPDLRLSACPQTIWGTAAGSLVALRGGVCAVNGRGSQSGYHCFRPMLAPLANGKRFLPVNLVVPQP